MAIASTFFLLLLSMPIVAYVIGQCCQLGFNGYTSAIMGIMGIMGPVAFFDDAVKWQEDSC